MKIFLRQRRCDVTIPLNTARFYRFHYSMTTKFSCPITSVKFMKFTALIIPFSAQKLPPLSIPNRHYDELPC